MKKNLFVILIACISTISFAQDDPFASWNANYREVDIDDLLSREEHYADSIENDRDIVQFYVRQDGYRFMGRFTGNRRKIDPETIKAMKMVFKYYGGDLAIFDEIRREVEIVAGDRKIWMPIQPVLEKPFEYDVAKNSDVYIYALFMNLHSNDGKLNNIFLISEFIPQ